MEDYWQVVLCTALALFGGSHIDQSMMSLGFKGNPTEKVSDCIVYGKGVRCFHLRRFLAYDAHYAPFGLGGINGYTAFGNNPPVRNDKSGHMMGEQSHEPSEKNISSELGVEGDRNKLAEGIKNKTKNTRELLALVMRFSESKRLKQLYEETKASISLQIEFSKEVGEIPILWLRSQKYHEFIKELFNSASSKHQEDLEEDLEKYLHDIDHMYVQEALKYGYEVKEEKLAEKHYVSFIVRSQEAQRGISFKDALNAYLREDIDSIWKVADDGFTLEENIDWLKYSTRTSSSNETYYLF